jgi:hypothetical protein
MGAILLREIMEKKFHEIMENFKRGTQKLGIKFDYDIFINTYMKCNDMLVEKDINEEQIIQYFWVAFLNNSKKNFKQLSKYTLVDLEEAAEVLDEPYDERRTIVYETIIDNVKSNFKEEEFKTWYLHFAKNKSYEDLAREMYQQRGLDYNQMTSIFRRK